MTVSASGALAVELHRHAPTRWTATYYPMVETPAGRWADVTWALHRCALPASDGPPEPARWLEARSPAPGHPCYAQHRAWSKALAAGYVAAQTVHGAGDVEEPLSAQDAQRLRENTVVIPAGQLSEWVLDDLQDATSGIRA